MKLKNMIVVCMLAICVLFLASCSGKKEPSESVQTPETTATPPVTTPKDDAPAVLKYEKVYLIYTKVECREPYTYSIFVDYFGLPGEKISDSPLQYGWELTNGDVLYIWFEEGESQGKTDMVSVDWAIGVTQEIIDMKEMITQEDADKISVGMTLTEIIDILHIPGANCGFGRYWIEWKMEDGRVLAVEINFDDTIDDWVATEIRCYDELWGAREYYWRKLIVLPK